MSHLVALGRVTADLELKTSVRQHPYIQFSLAEQIGYGETAHTQYIQVWAWGAMTQQRINRGVRKGSFISVSGSLELEEYTKKDGGSSSPFCSPRGALSGCTGAGSGRPKSSRNRSTWNCPV